MSQEATHASSPNGWEEAPLGELLVDATYGLSIRGARSGQVPILRMNSQEDGRIVFKDLQFVDLDERTIDKFRLDDGDVLFNRTNSYELVGRTALFEGKRDSVFASYLIRLRVDRKRMDPAFLTLLMNLPGTQERLKGFATRGVSQANISASKLKTLSVAFPELGEQRRIAVALGKLQRARVVESRRLAALRDLKAATMAKLFREGLRGERLKETEIGEMPESWRIVKLGDPDFATLSSGGTPSRGTPDNFGGGIPWAKSGELMDSVLMQTEETLSEVGLAACTARIYPTGSLLVAMYGATAGATSVLGIPAATNQAVCAVQHVHASFTPEFLRHHLVHVRRRLLAARHGGAQPNLSQQILRGVLIPVPSAGEQHEIAAMLVAVSSDIAISVKRAQRLGALFASALSALMAGTLRLPEFRDA